MKTIRQIADEIGVTKQAVQKRISREPLCTSLSPYIETKKGTKYIDQTGENLIIAAFSLSEQAKATTASIPKDTDNVYAIISVLQGELEIKNKQIDRLTEALENTTKSLQAAQALHAGTIQKQISEGQEAPQEAENAADRQQPAPEPAPPQERPEPTQGAADRRQPTTRQPKAAPQPGKRKKKPQTPPVIDFFQRMFKR